MEWLSAHSLLVAPRRFPLALCGITWVVHRSSRDDSRALAHDGLGGTAMARDQRLARVFVLCLFISVVLSAPFTASRQLSIDPAFAKGGGRAVMPDLGAGVDACLDCKIIRISGVPRSVDR